MAEESVPYRYRRASEAETLAVRTFHRSAIRVPRFLVEKLDWTPGTHYTVTRRDGYHIVRDVGDDGDTMLAAKQDGQNRNVSGYELYPSETDVPWVKGDDVVLEVSRGTLQLREPTADDYDAIRQDEIRRMGYAQATGDTVYDLYEDRIGMDVTDHLPKVAFSNVWFTDDWLFGAVTVSENSHREGFNVPTPLFLPTLFEAGDSYGVARAEDGIWYLCPPEHGDFTGVFVRTDTSGLQFRTREFPGLDIGDTVQLTYDPEGDTLVIYTVAASPFPDTASDDRGEILRL